MRKFALLGKHLDYSFSESFFQDFFQKNKIDASYENLEMDSLEEFFLNSRFSGYSGFNVTIPFKSAVIPFLGEISEEASAIGAVNTIRISGNKLIGYNTDAFGFQRSIKPFLNNNHERALILGTGGASKAVAYVLKNIGLDVLFVSRTPQAKNQFSYRDINANMVNACKLIVNCTPLGTFPALDEKPDFPTAFLSSSHLVVDLIYNPEKTRLLKEAEQHGALILNGASMLKEQALQSWKIWNEEF